MADLMVNGDLYPDPEWEATERLAAHIHQFDEPGRDWETLHVSGKNLWRSVAKAALAEMRHYFGIVTSPHDSQMWMIGRPEPFQFAEDE